MGESTYVREMGVGEGPADRPSAGLALHELRYGVVGYLCSCLGSVRAIGQETHCVLAEQVYDGEDGCHLAKHRGVPSADPSVYEFEIESSDYALALGQELLALFYHATHKARLAPIWIYHLDIGTGAYLQELGEYATLVYFAAHCIRRKILLFLEIGDFLRASVERGIAHRKLELNIVFERKENAAARRCFA